MNQVYKKKLINAIFVLLYERVNESEMFLNSLLNQKIKL